MSLTECRSSSKLFSEGFLTPEPWEYDGNNLTFLKSSHQDSKIKSNPQSMWLCVGIVSVNFASYGGRFLILAKSYKSWRVFMLSRWWSSCCCSKLSKCGVLGVHSMLWHSTEGTLWYLISVLCCIKKEFGENVKGIIFPTASSSKECSDLFVLMYRINQVHLEKRTS